MAGPSKELSIPNNLMEKNHRQHQNMSFHQLCKCMMLLQAGDYVKNYLHSNQSGSHHVHFGCDDSCSIKIFLHLFTSTPRVPPSRVFPKPQSTHFRISICFLSSSNSSNHHSLLSHFQSRRSPL